MLTCYSILLTQVIWPIKKLEFIPSSWPPNDCCSRCRAKKLRVRGTKDLPDIDIVSSKKGQLFYVRDRTMELNIRQNTSCDVIQFRARLTSPHKTARALQLSDQAPLKEINVTLRSNPGWYSLLATVIQLYQAIQFIRELHDHYTTQAIYVWYVHF